MPPYIDIIEKNKRELRSLMTGAISMRENLLGGWLKKNNQTLKDLKHSPDGNPYSIKRTCCESIVLGLLLAGGMSPEDVFNPEKGRKEKDQIAGEVIGKMFAADKTGAWIEDYEWVTHTIQKAVRGLVGAFERMAHNMDLSTLPEAMQPKNAAFYSIGNACYDLYQEMMRVPKKTTPYRAPEFHTLEDQSSILGKFMYPLEHGYFGSLDMLDPVGSPGLQLSHFVSGVLSLRHVRERLAENRELTVYEAYSEVAEPMFLFQQQLGMSTFEDGPLGHALSRDRELCEAFSYSIAAGLLEDHLVDDGPMDDPNRRVRLMLEGVDIFAEPERAKELLIRNELRQAGLSVEDVHELAEAAGMRFEAYLDELRAENLAAESAPAPIVYSEPAAPIAVDTLFAQRSTMNKQLGEMRLSSDEIRENLFREQLGTHGLTLKTMTGSRPDGNPYSVGRSACATLTIGLLLAEGMPLSDVFDPEKGRTKKAEIAGEVVHKMLAVGPDQQWIADYEWVGKRMQRAARGFIRVFDEKMKTMDLSRPDTLYRPENAQFLLMCRSMHDLMQEIVGKSDGKLGTHYRIEAVIEPDFEKNAEKLRRAGFYASGAEMASRAMVELTQAHYPYPEMLLGNIINDEYRRRVLEEKRKAAPNAAFSDLLMQMPDPMKNFYTDDQLVKNGLKAAMANNPSYARVFAEAAVTGQLTKHLQFSGRIVSGEAKYQPAQVVLQGIDVLTQPEKAKELFFMDAHDLTYADVARLKTTHAVDLLEKPEMVSQILTLEELGLTMGEVQELAEVKGISVQAYLDEIMAQNAAAAQPENIKNTTAPKAEFETLGDVERFIESEKDKSVEQMVTAIRALNTISENSTANAYACYQAGELVNTLGAALMKRLRNDPEHASVFTKSDIKRIEGTMNRHRSAAKKMKTATTLRKEDSEKLLKSL